MEEDKNPHAFAQFVLIGVGTFAATGVALYGLHLAFPRLWPCVKQCFRHSRNLQLIERSDDLYNLALGKGNMEYRQALLQEAHRLLTKVDEEDLIGARELLVLYNLYNTNLELVYFRRLKQTAAEVLKLYQRELDQPLAIETSHLFVYSKMFHLGLRYEDMKCIEILCNQERDVDKALDYIFNGIKAATECRNFKAAHNFVEWGRQLCAEHNITHKDFNLFAALASLLRAEAYNAESPKERKAKWEELAEEAATFAKKHSMSDSSILPLYLMWVRALSMDDGESAASLMKEETRRQFVKEHGKENREGLLGSVLLYCGDAYLHHGMRHQASKMFRKLSQINEKSLMLTESSFLGTFKIGERRAGNNLRRLVVFFQAKATMLRDSFLEILINLPSKQVPIERTFHFEEPLPLKLNFSNLIKVKTPCLLQERNNGNKLEIVVRI